MSDTIKMGVLGASGYTGADLVRLALAHPAIEITALTANSHAGKTMAEVFPHLGFAPLPRLTTIDEADWSTVDAVVCGLPHGTTQEITKRVLADHPTVKFIDMSADFRLRDPLVYEGTYGLPHQALALQSEAVYGLSEHYRTAIRDARLVACPGCYPTAALLALLPLVEAGRIASEEINIDAKSGVTGAGRSLKQNI
jgi:N-acetyl-gamma-glutamyl-phosphate reductase